MGAATYAKSNNYATLAIVVLFCNCFLAKFYFFLYIGTTFKSQSNLTLKKISQVQICKITFEIRTGPWESVSSETWTRGDAFLDFLIKKVGIRHFQALRSM